jgi:sialidase-1
LINHLVEKFCQTVFQACSEGYHTYRIPALVRTANGDMLAICEARRDSARDEGKIDLILKRSSDGGKTWGKIEKIHGEEGDTAIGNPCPILDSQGRIHLLYCRNNLDGLWVICSGDHGLSWGEPRLLAEVGELEAMFGFSIQRFGTGPCHGIQLKSGRFVVPVWMKEGASYHYQEGTFRVGLLLSDDGGVTWRAGATGEQGANESAVAELPDGTLIMNSRSMSNPAGYRLVAISRDGGESFVEKFRDEALTCSNCQGSLATANDGSLLFCNPPPRNPVVSYNADLRRELTLRRSVDGGRNWLVVCEIEPGPSGYSDLCVLPDGRCAVLFEVGKTDYRESIAFAAIPLNQ